MVEHSPKTLASDEKATTTTTTITTTTTTSSIMKSVGLGDTALTAAVA